MFAEVNGARLFYTTHGEGPPVLVMHGGMGYDHAYLRPWLDGLGRHASLIYYDQRGNGRSTRPDDWETVDHATWAADADALREHFGFDQIILFGHSYGSFLAQEYALRYGNRLAGLILSNTAPALDYVDVALANARRRGTPEQLQALMTALSGPVADDATLGELVRTFLPLYFHQVRPDLADVMQETQYDAGAFNRSFFGCLPVFNTLSRLCEIAAPTLLLAGADDWLMPPAYGVERMHREMPRSQVVVFEQSGHFPFVEETDRFTSVVSDWLNTLGPV